jgi:hypothetical protein
MFPCEREGCGHPLNRHNPCNAVVGADDDGEPVLCTCETFEPDDQRRRVALLTDVVEEKPPAQLAQEFMAEFGRRKGGKA